MHVLVQCPSCKRQSDAGELEIGSKFHCVCGEVLEVPRVRAKDAAVVRCSSCGGPRTAGAPSCGFCGADFTMHERDLHTICPSCMARIMDRAKFCHNCGTPIIVQGKGGAPTDHPCPACGSQRLLGSRTLGEPPVAVLECRFCGGLWVGSETFELLTERMKDQVSPAAAMPGGPKRAPKGRSMKQQGPLYRRCPKCKKMMARRNYAKWSGVIIDSCREHGIWFDAGELHTLLQWIRQGGQRQAEQRQREEARQAERRKRAAKVPSRLDRLARQGGAGGFPVSRAGDSSALADILGALFNGTR